MAIHYKTLALLINELRQEGAIRFTADRDVAEIHFYAVEKVKSIAQEMNLPYTISERDSEYYNREISVMCNDIKIFAIYKEETNDVQNAES